MRRSLLAAVSVGILLAIGCGEERASDRPADVRGVALLSGNVAASADLSADEAHVRVQVARMDSVVAAMDSLNRWCNTASYKTPKYLRNVCPLVKLRPDRRVRAAEDSLLIPPVPPDTVVPTPTPVPPPDTTSPGTATAAILKLIGPTKSVAETGPLGAAFARYDSLFTQYLPPGSTDTWDNNYYDRAVAFYARYVRTGDTVFLRRASTIALAYRRDYLEANAYGTSPHWSQVRGLELHYRLTGDTLSRRAVAGAFAHGMLTFTMPVWGPLADIENTQSAHMENRIQARALQAALSAHRMGGTYTRPDGWGGEFGPTTWPAKLRDMLNKILSTQNPDGSWSWAQICGGQLNYMVGMLNDVLIEYYRDFEADGRIPTAIERANEYLWSTQWLATDQAFKYASTICPNIGGHEPAGDLNGLLIASFGWLYQRTGDVKWKTRGDAIMAGLVLQRWAGAYASSKQFNQAFAESYRYLGWR